MDGEDEDYRLALRARTGDRDALAELADRHRAGLFAAAYAELRHYEDAQDAVAAALLRICRHAHTLRAPGQMRAWMYQVVRNEARRLLRRRASGPIPAELEETPSAAGDGSLLRLDVERALRRLPADLARALALFYLSGLSIPEIARRVGRPEGTVKSWLHHGRRRLALEMQEYAPMPQEWTASIVSTQLDLATLEELSTALRAAGWSEVRVVREFPVPLPVGREAAIAREFHLPTALQGSRFIVLDEWIAGRSAFELYPILNITAERKDLFVGLLLDPGAAVSDEARSYAAWAAGFDLLLVKPVVNRDFQVFAGRFRAQLAAADEGGSVG